MAHEYFSIIFFYFKYLAHAFYTNVAKVVPGLTKYHAMETYPVLNYASHNEGALVSGAIAPGILKLGTRWR
jgi:hypothetical protein